MIQTRIMAYSAKPPNAPEHHLNGNKVLYSSGAKAASASKRPNVRHIPQVHLTASIFGNSNLCGKFQNCRCRRGFWTRPSLSTTTT